MPVFTLQTKVSSMFYRENTCAELSRKLVNISAVSSPRATDMDHLKALLRLRLGCPVYIMFLIGWTCLQVLSALTPKII